MQAQHAAMSFRASSAQRPQETGKLITRPTPIGSAGEFEVINPSVLLNVN
jgi:hypothetical protein